MDPRIEPTLRWREMIPDDLPGVMALSRRVHPGLPEDEAVFAERIALYPGGCLVLANEGRVGGYALAHPIQRLHPPALNTRLGALADDADSFYIHDFVVAPEVRGAGHAREGIERLLRSGQRFPATALISVYGTAGFWARFGFRPVEDERVAARMVRYGEGALYMLRDNSAVASD